MNSSWVVVSHLNRVSEPTERDLYGFVLVTARVRYSRVDTDTYPRRSAFQSLLEKRDIYALSLLRLRAQTDAVQSSRNIARKRLLRTSSRLDFPPPDLTNLSFCLAGCSPQSIQLRVRGDPTTLECGRASHCRHVQGFETTTHQVRFLSSSLPIALIGCIVF